jgi:rhomboid family GlyGly-CTERM serine protease
MKHLSKRFLMPIVLSLIILAVAALGEVGIKWLKYIGPLEHGEGALSFRWLTGHFTHLGWRHSWLNIAGLMSVGLVYGHLFSVKTWLIFIMICAFGISLGLYFYSPQIEYYVGLSGVLHGMLALAVSFAILHPLLSDSSSVGSLKWEEILVFIGLWTKVAYEQILGAVPITATIAGDVVIVDAHFYGACLGTVYSVFLLMKLRLKSSF